ncbi:MAG TPA: TIGR03560 family F420-dependent LLM class oxidoreductase [Acidimicrobiales bacterium]|nr:TIGR03560 family F420-dependent LLM class oxidoreductase [Acidimicrobiales bacterium]
MRFGFWPDPSWSWEEVRAVSERVAAAGWHAVYFADHFMPNDPEGAAPRDGDIFECWSVLAALAATVPDVRLAPLVTSVTYRHPAVLANIAATVDRISGGRLTLGVGAGWQQNEHAAYGLDLGSVTERLDRFEEACEALVGLLRQPRTSLDGRYVHLADAPNQPTPAQERLPLLIGGGGERRMLRIVARFADEWNTWSTPEVLAHKREVLGRHCAEVGRDPAEIHVSTQALVFIGTDEAWLSARRGSGVAGTPAQVVEQLAAYAEAGADEFIVPGFTFGKPERRLEAIDMLSEEVLPALRDA